jgi:hypothetical protein
MAKQVLNVGTANNDKTGDTLRAGGLKIKANFDEIYAALASNGVNISGGNVLKTGDYQDLSNKPVFATVATTGDFYDLTDRPDIGIFVGAPANEMGSDGHVAGNMAFDSNFLYVCKEDYVQQDQFTGFSGVVDNAGVVVYTLNAASTSTGTTVTLAESPGSYTPQVGWEIGDGTTTRTITNVDTSGDDIVLTLDGAFTATTGTPYHIIYSVNAGQHVLIVNWNSTAYQDLFDQYTVDEKPAKLFISADGYGRVVNDVILNSTDDELYFVYTAGSAIGSFTGLTFRFNQPAIWESVAWETVFGVPGSGGTANTGDITFDGVKIIGDGTASGDGLGYSTMELVPDTDLYGISPGGDFGSGGQYLVIDPTSPNHIHIRAGGPQDEAAAQLILGGEKANVVVRDQDNSFTENHHVIINSQANDGTPYTWQFDQNGDLNLPTNGGIVFDRANTTIRVGMGFHIASGEGISIDAIDETDPANLVYKNWYFGSDGNLTFPDATVQETAWAGGRVVTVPTHSTGAIGDLEGDLSFSNGHIYYCTADYGQVGHQVSVATAYNGATSLNTNSFQLTKSADTLQIAVGDIISDSNGGATSVVASVSSDANYTYVGTGSFAYAAVFPLTFTSTDYVSGGNIWKRVAWSNDTW